jgi:hypothetical protein
VSGKPVESGLFEAGFSGFADRFSASFVFVVGSHISHCLVKSHGVVVDPGGGDLGSQGRRVTDREQVWVLDLDVPVEALDSGLVGGSAGPPEVLGDRAQRHELPR